jgi:hypothetical protein
LPFFSIVVTVIITLVHVYKIILERVVFLFIYIVLILFIVIAAIYFCLRKLVIIGGTKKYYIHIHVVYINQIDMHRKT